MKSYVYEHNHGHTAHNFIPVSCPAVFRRRPRARGCGGEPAGGAALLAAGQRQAEAAAVAGGQGTNHKRRPQKLGSFDPLLVVTASITELQQYRVTHLLVD